MKQQYCTYFDHRYLARGLAMIRSLRRLEPNASVWVLCLNDATYDALTELSEPGVRSIKLSEFENGDGALIAAKKDGRSLIEYYFTCTPSLVRYVLNNAPEADVVTYLDGDLWFFSNPEPIYGEAGDASVLIIPHRFPPTLRGRDVYGIYNVGWVSFRRGREGFACLNWWRERCLEWCSDWVDAENGRFADQRYLDRFSSLFQGVHAVSHQGANLAPWNIAGRTITQRKGRTFIDAEPLLFFHFHGLRRFGRYIFLTNHHEYGAPMNRMVRRAIYMPYIRELRRIEHEITGDLPALPISRLSGSDIMVAPAVERFKNTLRALRAISKGSYVFGMFR